MVAITYVKGNSINIIDKKMKKKMLITVFAILLSLLSYGQDKYATTDLGERVILKEDGRWEYVIDSKKQQKFVEPKGDPKNQSFLKKVDATVDHMKKHVSVDTGCPIEKIILLELSEQKGSAIYIIDVCGVKMKYRRSGSAFFKDGEGPIGAK